MKPRKCNRNPILGRQSALVREGAYTDTKMTDLHASMRKGSVELLAAILRTGKLYRKMTPAEQLDAREYAYGPDLIDKRILK